MSNNPYCQVALTYLRRPFSSWKTGASWIFVLGSLVPMLFVSGRCGNHQNFAMQQLMPFGVLFFLLTIHVKEQFTDPRAHVMPDFRRVHGVIATAFALVFAVVFPALFTWWVGWHSIGFVAVAILAFSAILWSLLFLSGWFSWLVLILIFGASTETGRAMVQQLVTGDCEPAAAGVLALGTAMAIWGGMRLFGLREEMPEYRWINWEQAGNRPQFIGMKDAQDPISRRLQNWVSDHQIAILVRHAGRASVSRWSAICRWRAGMAYGWGLVMWVLAALIYVQSFSLWVPLDRPVSPHSPSPDLMMVAFALVFIPLGATMGVLTKAKSLGFELMLPVDRKTYFRQLGLAAISSLFLLWATVSATLLVWWMTLGPQPVPYATLFRAAAFAAVVQVLLFGVFAWFLRYRSQWAIILVMMILFPAAIVPMSTFITRPWEISPMVVGIGVALVLVGVLITWDAYRRWLRADFG